MASKKIVKITPIDYSGSVFNLHIKDNHNYFAGDINVSNCHQYKASVMSGIIEKATTVPFKFGFTGSLDGQNVHALQLEGLFGPVHRAATTSQLQETGQLADLKVFAVMYKHQQAMAEIYCRAEYKDEIDYLVTNKARNNMISKIAMNTTGNTLILFQFVEKHGNQLYEILKERAGDRPVYYIHGGVDVDDRNQVRTDLKAIKNAIVIASVGVFATGTNIPSIENIILASPTKSRIRSLQSIGRGLRLSEGKTHCTLFDIIDDLSYKRKRNITLNHGLIRYKLYKEEGFNVKFVEIKQ